MHQLATGDTVTVTVRNALYHARDRYANRYVGPEYNEYTGTVVREAWHGSDKIGLTTDVKGFPVRVLSLSSIVAVGGAEADFATPQSDRKVFTVQGSKGNTYTVTVENGKASCSCPGFGFRKTCRHAQEATL